MIRSTRNPLPGGCYRCTLQARNAISIPSLDGSQRTTLELHAVVSDGPHAGYSLTFRVWSDAKMQRARALRKGEPILAAVMQTVLDSGMKVNRVVDFRAASEASVIEAAAGSILGPGDEAKATGQQHGGIPVEELVAHLRRALSGTKSGPQKLAARVLLQPATRPACAADYTTGFSRVGGKGGPRDLVQQDDVLRAYAACEASVPTGVSGFVSIYQYTSDLANHVKKNGGSLAGYRGPCWARWLAIDLDGDGTDAGLDRVLDDIRKLVGVLLALGVPAESIAVFFSGGRGAHLLWPSSVLAAAPKDGFEATAGVVCRAIATLAGVEIDMNLYRPLACLRLPNTRHEETGLYKVVLLADELPRLNAASMKELARALRPFVMPDWAVAPVMPLHHLWRLACGVEATTRRRTAAVATGERRIFSDTFDLMVHGAPEGSRGTRFFKAAMNLLDFDCPESLLYALLEPAARLSGYPMTEFTAQIDGAIAAHGNDPETNQT